MDIKYIVTFVDCNNDRIEIHKTLDSARMALVNYYIKKILPNDPSTEIIQADLNSLLEKNYIGQIGYIYEAVDCTKGE